MLSTSQSNVQPEKVTIETCPDKTIVRLADNIIECETDEGVTVYEYDEAVFNLPEDRDTDDPEKLEESIETNFESWWLYASEDHTPPTLEQRVTAIEDILMEM